MKNEAARTRAGTAGARSEPPARRRHDRGTLPARAARLGAASDAGDSVALWGTDPALNDRRRAEPETRPLREIPESIAHARSKRRIRKPLPRLLGRTRAASRPRDSHIGGPSISQLDLSSQPLRNASQRSGQPSRHLQSGMSVAGRNARRSPTWLDAGAPPAGEIARLTSCSLVEPGQGRLGARRRLPARFKPARRYAPPVATFARCSISS